MGDFILDSLSPIPGENFKATSFPFQPPPPALGEWTMSTVVQGIRGQGNDTPLHSPSFRFSRLICSLAVFPSVLLCLPRR